MSNTSIATEEINASSFLTQADDSSSRPSKGEEHSTQDRLSTNTQTSDPYQDLVLPACLQGSENHFASFKKLAAQLQLPAETVQQLIDWEAEASVNGQQAEEASRADILQKWTEQSKEMFGVNYPREVARALAAAERFGGAELRELLEVTGLGSHPVMVKTFHQISQQISEDSSVGARERTSGDKTFAEALYGKAQ